MIFHMLSHTDDLLTYPYGISMLLQTADTRRYNNVIATSKRRGDVILS